MVAFITVPVGPICQTSYSRKITDFFVQHNISCSVFAAVHGKELAGESLPPGATKRVNLCTALNDALHTAMGADSR